MSAPEMINAGELVLKRWDPQWAEPLTEAVRESLTELKPFMVWAFDGYKTEDAAGFLAMCADWWKDGSQFNYAIFTSTGELIGSIGLMTRQGPGTLEVGYWLRTAYTGRGYMTAAVGAITRVAQAIEPGVRVLLLHDQANAASAAVARRAGFVEIDRREQVAQAPAETGIHVINEYRKTVVPPA